jgi:hypothetical protein
MVLKAGWLNRQFEKVSEDIRKWPIWMRREAGFLPASDTARARSAAMTDEEVLCNWAAANYVALPGKPLQAWPLDVLWKCEGLLTLEQECAYMRALAEFVFETHPHSSSQLAEMFILVHASAENKTKALAKVLRKSIPEAPQ